MTTSDTAVHLGKTFKAFLDDKAFWVDGLYQDDVLLIVNGVSSPDLDESALDDGDLVEIESGDMMTEGVIFPASHPLAGLGKYVSLEEALGLWLKRQNTRFLMVEYDDSAVDKDALLAHLAAFHPSIKSIT